MDAILSWIEHGVLSAWIRGATAPFPVIITLHTLGMGFLTGASWALDLRILGVARRMPLAPMLRFLPVFWIALGVNVASGILLLIAYPTKAITNPVFYVKMACIALGVTLVVKIKNEIVRRAPMGEGPSGRKLKRLAAASVLSWAAAITAGRLLAYTYTYLLVGVREGF